VVIDAPNGVRMGMGMGGLTPRKHPHMLQAAPEHSFRTMQSMHSGAAVPK